MDATAGDPRVELGGEGRGTVSDLQVDGHGSFMVWGALRRREEEDERGFEFTGGKRDFRLAAGSAAAGRLLAGESNGGDAVRG